MAVVSVNLTANFRRTTFTKPPDYMRFGTAIPRSIVNFFLNQTAVAAKPVNDQEELLVRCPLDPTFAYRLVDFSVSLIQDVAHDWETRGWIEVSGAIRGVPDSTVARHSVVLDDIFDNSSSEMWIAAADKESQRLPSYIIQDVGGVLLFDFKASNQTAAAGAAGTIDAYMTFFEYEIEQAQYFALHMAPLVYSR